MEKGIEKMSNLLEIPKIIINMTNKELEEERIKLLSDDNRNEKRYYQLIHEIVKRMFRYE